ncbi:MAG: ribose-5-phosphate isomerase A [Sulfolobus sp.]|jgi:ribose 5-phosphate isomerase A
MDAKVVASEYVLPLLREYKVIGLGTGRTVKTLISLMEKEGLLKDKLFLASSVDTEIEVSKRGGLVVSLFSGLRPEVYVDSFDSVLRSKVMVKGGGGALLREKMLFYFSKKAYFIGEFSKLVEKGFVKVPIEVVPASLSYVFNFLSEKYKVAIRESNGKMGGIVTDNGNYVLDVEVNSEDLCSFDKFVKYIPGVVEDGVFCIKDKDYEIILSDSNGRIEVF